MANVSPMLQKGTILVLEPNTGVQLNTIHFEYNPESIRRSLQPQSVGDPPDRTEVLRLKGPPVETIQCDIEIDATDQLASSDPTTMSVGIQPQLAVLELLCIRRAEYSLQMRFCRLWARLRFCLCRPI